MTGRGLIFFRCSVTDVFANNKERQRTNTWILEKIGTDLLLRSGIMMRKYRYFGHIVKRDGRIVQHILQGAMEGKSGKGCPSSS